MPVIVIGADTEAGAAILTALRPASSEIRVFVSDPDAAGSFRNAAKVAIGDVSDGSHVGGAAIDAFCAVAILAAANDGRERSFAAEPRTVLAQWADGLIDAGVARIILVGKRDEVPDPNPLVTAAAQYHFVSTDQADMVNEVARLEALPT